MIGRGHRNGGDELEGARIDNGDGASGGVS